MIGCDRIEILLPPYLDGEASSDERRAVDEHLEECVACRSTLHGLRRVDLAVARWSDLPDDMRPYLREIGEGVHQRIHRERLIAPMLFVMRRTLSLAVAAAIVLVVLGLGFSRLMIGSSLEQARQTLSHAEAVVAGPLLGSLRVTAAVPTPAPGQTGLDRQQLSQIVQITVTDYRKTSTKTVKDATKIKPAVNALAGARFVRNDPALEGQVADQTYLVNLGLKDGSTLSLVYLPSGKSPNVEDRGPRNWWNAPGLDAAMQPLLPSPPVAAVKSPSRIGDAVIASPYGWLPLPAGHYLDRWPSFSPDGSKIAFLPSAGDPGGQATRIIVRDVASGSERVLTSAPGYTYTSVRWSPNGKSLAFFRSGLTNDGAGTTSELWQIGADGTNPKLLLRRGPCSVGNPWPAVSTGEWSADGQELSVGRAARDCPSVPAPTARADGSGKVSRSASPEVPACATEPQSGWDRTAALSDKYKLCIVGARFGNKAGSGTSLSAAPGGASIVRYDGGPTDAGQVIAELPPGEDVLGVSVSPDSEWIAIWSASDVSSPKPAQRDYLRVVRSDGSGFRLVTGDPFHFVHQDGIFRWANDGRAYFEALPSGAAESDGGDLYELDAASATEKIMPLGSKIQSLADVSPDGRHLLVLEGSLPTTTLHLLTVSGPVAPTIETRPADSTATPTTLPKASAPSNQRVRQLPAPAISLAAVPGRPGTLYALLLTNTLYRSDDDGQTWRRLPLPAAESPNPGSTGDQPTASVVSSPRAVAVPTANPNRVFVVANRVLYRSDDGGASWTALNDAVYAWTVADPKGNVLYAWHGSTAAASGGLYRTADAGQTWQQVQGEAFPPLLASQHCPCNHQGINSLVADPRVPDTVYAGTDYGIFRSTDGGKQWTELTDGLPASSQLYRWSPILAVAPNGTVYALTDVSTNYATGAAALVRRRSGDSAWTVVGKGDLAQWQSPNDPFDGFQSLATDPANPDHVYVGSARGLLASDDGGATWRAVSLPSANAIYSMTVSKSSGAPTTLDLWTDTGFVSWTDRRG